MPARKRPRKPLDGRTARQMTCITHIGKHFDPTRYPERFFGWCEFHGRLHLLSDKTGRPLKTKIFTSSPKDVLLACDYHKSLNLITEVYNRNESTG